MSAVPVWVRLSVVVSISLLEISACHAKALARRIKKQTEAPHMPNITPIQTEVTPNQGQHLSEEDVKLVQRGWESQTAEFDYDIEVEGNIPDQLQGTFYRNGPGRMTVYDTQLVHPIDGDGMITSITFSKGKAHFRSKYVRTAGYETEEKQKRGVMKGMMGTVPANKPWGEWLDEVKKDVLRGKMPNQRYKNPSNTSVYYWGGKLMSCWEGGMPYNLDPRTLETKGREDIGGNLERSKSLAAHSRYDKKKDRLVTFGLLMGLGAKSKLVIYEFDKEWGLIQERTTELESYYYCHDLAITENYYLVHHSPFVSFDTTTIAKVVSGWNAPGELMRYYPNVPCRIIVIPRNKESSEEIRYLDIPPCHIYHHINAYEVDGHIKLSSVCIGENFNMKFDQKVWLSNFSEEPGHVYNFDIDLGSNTIKRELVDESACEFPTHHPDIDGRDWRYAYLMASEKGFDHIPFQDVIKMHMRMEKNLKRGQFDVKGTNRQVWSSRGEHGAIGEPVFVAREGGKNEDDGWVLVQVYYFREHKTQILVLDATELSRGPIARLKLSHHTPFTFHGTFCPEIF
ncbi:hypothetical protein PROFUN_14152 [Planoprotostelium fungivorum]|uniref:Uncharacterized protein n=1 Tax=Planoprotostelium fungivorum TaxID=1890364 RepID=A0A2P6N1M3_9EUKA|nr:hypothetical protein PROFUN_14152 [Planoprotostelium fungivorum]